MSDRCIKVEIVNEKSLQDITKLQDEAIFDVKKNLRRLILDEI